MAGYLAAQVTTMFTPQASYSYGTIDNDVDMQDNFHVDPSHRGSMSGLGASVSGKQGSVVSTSSYVNIATPSALTDAGESYGIIRGRAYSQNSNGTSGQGADSPTYSVPEEWQHGACYRVEKDTSESEPQYSWPHNQKDALANLGSGIPPLTVLLE